MLHTPVSLRSYQSLHVHSNHSSSRSNTSHHHLHVIHQDKRCSGYPCITPFPTPFWCGWVIRVTPLDSHFQHFPLGIGDTSSRIQHHENNISPEGEAAATGFPSFRHLEDLPLFSKRAFHGLKSTTCLRLWGDQAHLCR